MKHYSVFSRSTGELLRNLVCAENQLVVGNDETVVETQHGFDGYLDTDNQVKEMPTDRPSDYHKFDRVKNEWVDSLTVAERSFGVRFDRDKLLAETDWSQSVDVPEATKTKYQTYRQALRDIPQQAGFPTDINWPTKPE